jgi:hypothetical protein
VLDNTVLCRAVRLQFRLKIWSPVSGYRGSTVQSPKMSQLC